MLSLLNIVQDPSDATKLKFPMGNISAKNVADFMETSMPLISSGSIAKDFTFSSIIHGDLNGRNILIDIHQNVWLIDFEYTEKGPILKVC